jgi:hypothetical protein
MRIRKGIADIKIPSLVGSDRQGGGETAKSHKKCSSRLLLRRVCLWVSAIVGITIVQSRVFLELGGEGGITYSWFKFALTEVQDFLIRFRRTKPKIYIDIGPYESGTSLLQCALSRNAYEILKQDNVRSSHRTCIPSWRFSFLTNVASAFQMLYLGTCHMDCLPIVNGTRSVEPFEFCLPHSGAAVFTGKGDVKPRLKRKLQQLARSGRNALMVWEHFSDADPSKIQKFLDALDDKWEVHLIVHYRRLYSWLPAFYNQIQSPGWNGREALLIWPSDVFWRPTKLEIVRGRVRVPFDMFTEADMSRLGVSGRYRTKLRSIVNGSRHPVELALSRWSTNISSPSVHLVETHHLQDQNLAQGSDPLLSHLFCHVIPSLHKTCDAIRRSELEVLDVGRNERFPAENYDLLAIHAHRESLHPRGIERLSRPDAWDLIQERQEVGLGRNSSDFPLKCMPSKALEYLLKLSLAAEASIHPGQEGDHRRQFDDAVKDGEYCHLDAEATLEHPDWKDFFQPYTSVAPHVVERSSYGQSWTPKLDPFKSTDELFFSYVQGRPLKPWLPQLDLVGFLNVPGTGASVLLEHLLQSHKELSLLNHMNDSPIPLPSGEDATLACIFGSPARLAEPRTSSVSGSTLSGCPESVTYPDLLEKWLRHLPNLAAEGRIAGPYNESVASSASKVSSSSCPRRTRLLEQDAPMTDETYDETSDLQVSLTTVMVVRDPLDRLTSLFLDWKRHERTLEGHDALPHSLEHWLETVGTEAKGLISPQFAPLSEQLKGAVSRIKGPRANTLVLLHECWDLSIRLLSARHPTVFDAAVSNRVLRSRASASIRSNATSAAAQLGGDADALDDLQNKARSWFKEDYHFYDAAVARFRGLLKGSKIDEADVQECVTSLTERGLL